LVKQRAAEGYTAEWRLEGAGFVLLENHCPICAAASACSGFCRSELQLFHELLGPDATVERTDDLLTGARRCAYRITSQPQYFSFLPKGSSEWTAHRLKRKYFDDFPQLLPAFPTLSAESLGSQGSGPKAFHLGNRIRPN